MGRRRLAFDDAWIVGIYTFVKADGDPARHQSTSLDFCVASPFFGAIGRNVLKSHLAEPTGCIRKGCIVDFCCKVVIDFD